MEPPDPSFADEFNVPQEGAVLIFDVRRAAISLPSQVHRHKVLVEAGLVVFSSACFEFADKVPKEAQHGSLVTSRRLVLWGSARRYLLASSHCWPCCVHLSFHIGPRAPTLCSAWALRARYQFGRSTKVSLIPIIGRINASTVVL